MTSTGHTWRVKIRGYEAVDARQQRGAARVIIDREAEMRCIDCGKPPIAAGLSCGGKEKRT